MCEFVVVEKNQEPLSKFYHLTLVFKMDDNYHCIATGTEIFSSSSRYIIEDVIGKGAFALVARCHKSDTKKAVAVKIMKNTHMQQALAEEAVLTELKAFDPDRFNFIRWETSFSFRDLLCQEFELLDCSLRKFMMMRQPSTLSLTEIRPILQQLATALNVLKSLGISHTDLHPENIMLVNHVQLPLKVKIIDFGLSGHTSQLQQGTYKQPRWYRAPETILGLPCDEAIDMWSLGCIAYDILSFVTQTHGQLPESTGCILNRKADLECFVALVKQMLEVDSSKRIKPCQMLEHPFITLGHWRSLNSSNYVRSTDLGRRQGTPWTGHQNTFIYLLIIYPNTIHNIYK
uniref:Protein kinase domain-containing protein n=1 Tax=Stegastes partitus TaxID=144197 RepID=A0A3B5A7Y0_9TELE